jgi:gas vesicle protein
MKNPSQEQQHTAHNALLFWAGLLMGGLVGAVVMLLLAPQSGKETRTQIQHKGIELRDQAADTVEDAMAQVGQTAQQITGDVREKAEELQQRGQDIFNAQREELSALLAGNNDEVKIS